MERSQQHYSASVLYLSLFLGLNASACMQDVTVDEQEFRMAPPFELPDLAGNNVRLSDFEGKVVLLDIWATWCTPCLEGIPVYNELREKYQDDGFEIVGVTVQSPFDTIQPIVDKYEIEYPILVGNTDIENAYRLIGFPAAYLIDIGGTIRKTLLGTTQQAGAEDDTAFRTAASNSGSMSQVGLKPIARRKCSIPDKDSDS